MTTNPNAIRILCFGDSNTWGQDPERRGRLDVHERWTGILQQKLGSNFEIIEEGLSGRTTDVDYAAKPGRNGKTYFVPCLQSHYPLDAVVIMLGTNDLKLEYGPRPAAKIATAIKGLIGDVRQFAAFNGLAPKVVVASPIHIDAHALHFAKFYTGYYNEQSAKAGRELAAELEQIATDTRCAFVDAAQYAGPGDDGIHMTKFGHKAFAQALAVKIKEITT